MNVMSCAFFDHYLEDWPARVRTHCGLRCTMNQLFRFVNEGLAFGLELSALVALGYWGYHMGNAPWAKTLLAVGCVAVTAVLWGTFAAPRAIVKTPIAGVVAVKILVFGAAAAALYDVDAAVLATVFAILVVLNTTALTILRR